MSAESLDIDLEDDILDETIEEDAAALQENMKLNNTETDKANDNPEPMPEQNDLNRRLKEIEEEAKKIRDLQNEYDRQFNNSNASISSGSQPATQTPLLTFEEKAELDARSVYVGNVEYNATPDQLEEHFRGCGPIERVTILSDKFSGRPKGFAYIQFTEPDGMQNALALDESLFLGRQIKVSMKRTNKPGISTTNRPPKGRGFRGRGFGGFRGFRGMRGRPARRHGFAPY
uniref:RRM domain-containing protein n=1 Tax=Panagrolaimus sp. JU765 TaxID=591449 RepID=A0AC34PXI6_9BILA